MIRIALHYCALEVFKQFIHQNATFISISLELEVQGLK
jgi:hypothetical protein